MAFRLLKTFARVLTAPDTDKYNPNYIMFKPVVSENDKPITTIHIDEYIIPSENEIIPSCSRHIEETPEVIIVEPEIEIVPKSSSRRGRPKKSISDEIVSKTKSSSRRSQSKKSITDEIPYQRYKSGSSSPAVSMSELKTSRKSSTIKSKFKSKSPSYIQLGSVWNEGTQYPK